VGEGGLESAKYEGCRPTRSRIGSRSMNDLPQNTGDPKAVVLQQYVSVRLFRLSGRLSRKMRHAGQLAD
jgi:hypothetical protein